MTSEYTGRETAGEPTAHQLAQGTPVGSALDTDDPTAWISLDARCVSSPAPGRTLGCVPCPLVPCLRAVGG